ncbi:hypothetical protein H7R52_16815 [Weissella confusa]|uniref:Gram-positive cocci surface proteins LPxTG domain-containing protein n=1 Tax=Weissella confusa TaxID=1583 RepID=A0A923NGN9_WEICO|nr:hypothetical protein [Weissella confusa]
MAYTAEQSAAEQHSGVLPYTGSDEQEGAKATGLAMLFGLFLGLFKRRKREVDLVPGVDIPVGTPNFTEYVTYTVVPEQPVVEVEPNEPVEPEQTVQTVTPETPAIVPEVLTPHSLASSTTRTIIFRTSDGSIVDTKTQIVTYTRTATVDTVTGEVTYGPWTAEDGLRVPDVAVPGMPGYVADRVHDGYPAGGMTFDADATLNQTFVVTLAHGTKTVDPNNPGVPGAPIDPNNPDGPKWPAGVDEDHLKKPAVPSDPTTDTTIVYKVDRQHATVSFVDQNTQQVLHVEELSGDSYSKSSYTTAEQIADYEAQGYVRVPQVPGVKTPGEVTYPNDPDDPTKTADPNSPGYPVIPYVPGFKPQGPDGTPLQPVDPQNPSAGYLPATASPFVYTDWQAVNGDDKFDAKTSPVIPGYIADRLVVEEVAGMDETSEDDIQQVVYRQLGSWVPRAPVWPDGVTLEDLREEVNHTITYIYEKDGSTAAETVTDQVVFTRTVTINVVAAQQSAQPRARMARVKAFEVHFKGATITVTSDDPKVPGEPIYQPGDLIDPNDPDSPTFPDPLGEPGTPVDPDDPDSPTWPLKQTATITYINDETGSVLAVDTITGGSAETSTYTAYNRIMVYKLAGMMLVSNGYPSHFTFDRDETVVTPGEDNPATPGTPDNPTMPYVPGFTPQGPDGEPLEPVDPSNPSSGYWPPTPSETPTEDTTITYTAIVIAGYVADRQTVAALSDLTATSADMSERVVYSPIGQYVPSFPSGVTDVPSAPIDYPNNPDDPTTTGLKSTDLNESVTRTITYVDQAGKTMATTVKETIHFTRTATLDTVTGAYTYSAWVPTTVTSMDAVDSPDYLANGYELKEDGYPTDFTFDRDTTVTQAYTVTLAHGSQTIDPNDPRTPGTPINPDNPDGPKYPDGDNPSSGYWPPALPSDPTTDTTIEYKADEQKATITYIDTVTGNTLVVDTITGGSDESSTYTTADRLGPSYPANTPSVPTDPITYPNDPDDPTEPLAPGETNPNDPGDPENPTLPYVPGFTPQGPDGPLQPVDHVDVVTGAVTYGDWVATNADTSFDAVDSPMITGYVADKQTVAAVTGIGAKDADTTVNVVYNKMGQWGPINPDDPTSPTYPVNPGDTPTPTYPGGLEAADLNESVTQTIMYKYANGSPAADDATDTVTFSRTATTTADKIAAYEAAGYVLISNGYPGSEFMFDREDDYDQAYEVVLEHAVITVDPNDPKTPSSPIFTPGVPLQPVDPSDPSKGYVPPATPTDPTQDTTITYVANEQQATIAYIGKTTGKQLAMDTITGHSDETSTSDIPLVVTYTAMGQWVPSYPAGTPDVPTDPITYPNDPADPTQPADPTAPNYPVIPDVPGFTPQGPDGSDPKTDTVTFSRTATLDPVTGAVTYGEWIAANSDTTFDAVTSPVITGYVADKQTVAEVTGIQATDGPVDPSDPSSPTYPAVPGNPGDPIDPDNPSGPTWPATPTYPAGLTETDLNESVTQTITYVYTDGQEVTTAERMQVYLAQGYTLVSDGYPGADFTFDRDDSQTQAYEVHLKHATITITPSDPKTPSQPIYNPGVLQPVNPSDPSKGYVPPATPTGNPGEDTTINYVANEQTATITFIDDTTKTNLAVDTITGVSDATSTCENVKVTYKQMGQWVPSFPANTPSVPADPITYPNDPDDPTQPLEPGAPDYPVIPYVPGFTPQGPDGLKTVTDSVQFTRTAEYDVVTGKVTYGDWVATNGDTTFDAVESPVITGYYADLTQVAETADLTTESGGVDPDDPDGPTYPVEPGTPGEPIDPDNPSGPTWPATPTYPDGLERTDLNESVDRTITYVYEDGGEAGTTADRIAALQAQGYSLVSNGWPADFVFDTDDDTTQAFEVHLKHATITIDPDDPKTPSSPVYTPGDLTITGYTANRASVAEATGVTADDADTSIEVRYIANEQHATITYIDDNTQQTLVMDNITGQSDGTTSWHDDLNQTVTRNVMYVYDRNGETAATTATETLTFTRTATLDTVSGDITYGDWIAANSDTTFDEVTSLITQTITPDDPKTPSDPIFTPGDPVDPSDPSSPTYPEQPGTPGEPIDPDNPSGPTWPATPTYPAGLAVTTNTDLSVDTIDGHSDETSSYTTAQRIAMYEQQGYRLVADGYPGTDFTFDRDTATNQAYIVQLELTPDNPTMPYVPGFTPQGPDGTPLEPVTPGSPEGGYWPPATPTDNPGGDTVVTYVADEQKATITYHAVDATTGLTATTADENIQVVYKPMGQWVPSFPAGTENVPSDPTTYPNDPAHADTPLEPGDSNTNVPDTITYVDEAGNTVFDAATDKVSFTRTATVDAVTGEVTYGAWVATGNDTTFDAVNSPVKTGYYADKEAKNPSTPIYTPGDPVDPSDPSSPTYPAEPGEPGEPIDPDNPSGPTWPAVPTYPTGVTTTDLNETVNRDDIDGVSDEKSTYTTADRLAAYYAQGYTLVSDEYPADFAFDRVDGNVETFEVHLKHAAITVTPDDRYVPGFTPQGPDGELLEPVNPSNPSEGYWPPVIPDDPKQSQDITYTANEQTARIVFIDDTTGTTLASGATESTSVVVTYTAVGQWVPHFPPGTEDVPSDPINYPNNPDDPTNPANPGPDNPADPGTTDNPTLRDGKTAATTVTDNVVFERTATVNAVTGAVTYGEWTAVGDDVDWQQVDSPMIVGYMADKASVEFVDVIFTPGDPVDPSDPSSPTYPEEPGTPGDPIDPNNPSGPTWPATPTYPAGVTTADLNKTVTRTITYVYEDEPGTYATADRIKQYEAMGYVLVDDKYPANFTFDSDTAKSQDFTVTLKQVTVVVTPDDPKNPSDPRPEGPDGEPLTQADPSNPSSGYLPPNPANPGEDTVITYVPADQVGSVTYVDATTGTTLSVDPLAGKCVSETVTYKKLGQWVPSFPATTPSAPTDPIDYPNNPSDPTVPTDPAENPSEPGTPENPTLPYVPGYIHDPHTDAVHFTRTATLDTVTGEVTYSDWVAVNDDDLLDTYKSPVIDGYYADKAYSTAVTVAAEDGGVDPSDPSSPTYPAEPGTPGEPIDPANPSGPTWPETPTYPAGLTAEDLNQTVNLTVNYVYEDGTTVGTTADRIKAYEAQGYTLVSDDFPADFQFDRDDATEQKFEVHLKRTVLVITPDDPRTPSDPIFTPGELLTPVDPDNPSAGYWPPETPTDKPGDDTVIHYVANDQAARITFIDDDTKLELAVDTISGESSDTSTCQWVPSFPPSAADEDVPDDPIDYPNNPSDPTEPLEPGVNNPNDPGTPANPTLPYVPGYTPEGPDGTPSRTATVNAVTGAVTYGAWQTTDSTLDKVDSPLISGYVASQLTVAEEADVDAMADDTTVAITYTKLVVPDTPGDPGTPVDPDNPSGPTWPATPTYPSGVTKDDLNQTVTRTITYTYASNGEKASETVTETLTCDTDQPFTVHLKQATVTVDPSSPKEPGTDIFTPGDPVDPSDPSGPTYPESPYTPGDPVYPDQPDGPMANEQKATVTFIDDTTGNTLKVVDLTGKSDETDAYRTATDIATYERAGYVLVSDDYPTDGVVYDRVGLEPGQGTPDTPGDTDNPTLPYVPGFTPEGPDGTPLEPVDPNDPSAGYWPPATPTDNPGGDTTITYRSPVISGYYADIEDILAVTITPDDFNRSYMVTYYPMGQYVPVFPEGTENVPSDPITYPNDPDNPGDRTDESGVKRTIDGVINYQYADGAEAAPDVTRTVTFERSITLDAVTGEQISTTDWVVTAGDDDWPETAYAARGYVLVNQDATATAGTYDDADNVTQFAKVYLDHGTVVVTPDNPGDPGNPMYPDVPGTPTWPQVDVTKGYYPPDVPDNPAADTPIYYVAHPQTLVVVYVDISSGTEVEVTELQQTLTGTTNAAYTNTLSVSWIPHVPDLHEDEQLKTRVYPNDPNDASKVWTRDDPNYVEVPVPYIPGYTPTSDGSSTPLEQIDPTFTASVTYDAVTGEVVSIVWPTESQNFDDVQTPVIDGYFASEGVVAGGAVDYNDASREETITYTKLGAGNYDRDDTATQIFVVHLNHGTVVVDGGREDDPNHDSYTSTVTSTVHYIYEADNSTAEPDSVQKKSPTGDTTINYTRNTQQVIVRYIDDTTNLEVTELRQTFSGETDQAYTNTLSDYATLGYTFVSAEAGAMPSDPIQYPNDPNNPTDNETPHDPAEPGDPVIPYVPGYTPEGPDGTPLKPVDPENPTAGYIPPAPTEPVSIEWPNDSATFAAVKSPVITGYVADVTQVDADQIDHNDTDTTYKVTYKPMGSWTPSFPPNTENEIGTESVPGGKTDDPNYTDYTKTITRTIKYVDQDGNQMVDANGNLVPDSFMEHTFTATVTYKVNSNGADDGTRTQVHTESFSGKSNADYTHELWEYETNPDQSYVLVSKDAGAESGKFDADDDTDQVYNVILENPSVPVVPYVPGYTPEGPNSTPLTPVNPDDPTAGYLPPDVPDDPTADTTIVYHANNQKVTVNYIYGIQGYIADKLQAGSGTVTNTSAGIVAIVEYKALGAWTPDFPDTTPDNPPTDVTYPNDPDDPTQPDRNGKEGNATWTTRSTVRYRYEDGTTAAAANVRTITFTATVTYDAVTGEALYDTWDAESYTFDDVESPAEITDWVQTVTGDTGKTYTNVPWGMSTTGYVVVAQDAGTRSGTFDNDTNTDQTYYVYLKHNTVSVEGGSPAMTLSGTTVSGTYDATNNNLSTTDSSLQTMTITLVADTQTVKVRYIDVNASDKTTGWTADDGRDSSADAIVLYYAIDSQQAQIKFVMADGTTAPANINLTGKTGEALSQDIASSIPAGYHIDTSKTTTSRTESTANDWAKINTKVPGYTYIGYTYNGGALQSVQKTDGTYAMPYENSNAKYNATASTSVSNGAISVNFYYVAAPQMATVGLKTAEKQSDGTYKLVDTARTNTDGVSNYNNKTSGQKDSALQGVTGAVIGVAKTTTGTLTFSATDAFGNANTVVSTPDWLDEDRNGSIDGGSFTGFKNGGYGDKQNSFTIIGKFNVSVSNTIRFDTSASGGAATNPVKHYTIPTSPLTFYLQTNTSTGATSIVAATSQPTTSGYTFAKITGDISTVLDPNNPFNLALVRAYGFDLSKVPVGAVVDKYVNSSGGYTVTIAWPVVDANGNETGQTSIIWDTAGSFPDEYIITSDVLSGYQLVPSLTYASGQMSSTTTGSGTGMTQTVRGKFMTNVYDQMTKSGANMYPNENGTTLQSWTMQGITTKSTLADANYYYAIDNGDGTYTKTDIRIPVNTSAGSTGDGKVNTLTGGSVAREGTTRDPWGTTIKGGETLMIAEFTSTGIIRTNYINNGQVLTLNGTTITNRFSAGSGDYNITNYYLGWVVASEAWRRINTGQTPPAGDQVLDTSSSGLPNIIKNDANLLRTYFPLQYFLSASGKVQYVVLTRRPD